MTDPATLPADLAGKLDALRVAYLGLANRRKIAWDSLDGCKRQAICRVAFLDQQLALLPWDDLPPDAQEEIGGAVRYIAGIVAGLRMRGAL